VKEIALRQIAELDERARQLTEMADALRHLAGACEGNDRPECPIINDLEGVTKPRARQRRAA
jgi:MerR family copper efflux transcriptional regulator